MQVSCNFGFLERQDERLARRGALAERYFFDDAPAALIKLRQLAEFIAKEVAARHGLLPATTVNFDDVLRTLKLRAILPAEIANLVYHLKRAGNAAAHGNTGSPGDALTALKIARNAAAWFHATYGNAPDFKPAPFAPPASPTSAAAALTAELDRLRAEIGASADNAAKLQLAQQEAESARRQALTRAETAETERAFWEQYAADTEAGLRQTVAALKAAQAAALATPPPQLDLLARVAADQAAKVEFDEATTRVLIDDQLRAAGWTVDTAVLRYAAGVRPQPGRAMAIAEWPTSSGPVDYALFLDGRCLGVIEAKRGIKDVPGRLGQAKRYARDIQLTEDETPEGSPWVTGLNIFRVPFLFVTKGRPYVKQLETKSGTWFWDARRSGSQPRALPGGSPRGT